MLSFFVLLLGSCSSEYALKIDTVSGALGNLQNQNVTVDTYCGFMLNPQDIFLDSPERLLGQVFARPDYCHEGDVTSFDCNWYNTEDSFYSEALEYDINDDDTVIYSYGLQHQGTFEDRILLSILDVQLQLGTVYRLIGKSKKRGFLFDQSLPQETIEEYSSNLNPANQYVYAHAFKLTEWILTVYEEVEDSVMTEDDIRIEGALYQPTTNTEEKQILYPCMQPI